MADRIHPYETAAEQVTVTGWACRTCHRFFGNAPDAEHIANHCCCIDRPCDTDGCDGRAERNYTKCIRCISKNDLARYLTLTRVEWDGTTPIVTDDNEFFWDSKSLAEWLDDLTDDERESVRLEVCEPSRPPVFLMSEFLSDVLPEDDSYIDDAEINKVVNNWIAAHEPFSWIGSGKVPTAASVSEHTGIRIGGTDG